ncbi:hypothetical protein DICPUDRAFT_93196 [Dictyostelium purpureum]|uniref:Uncharacterized protein n=1 Tax=Dictyostelium purpureum TaxID=5786 RepID=F1A3R3_DICPU|nr:uncharacterized protein DICPUDRAFT_93196 [Dictyostelium purpureum]EGC29172.1 hypothetical protein DICPUDRAFT_93196 [Dictyostelium purpureum]|eukprot:XP_003294307.1 hypothetical protein DICPUDRAFT_93196 [Dictyostelium purpureum]
MNQVRHSLSRSTSSTASFSQSPIQTQTQTQSTNVNTVKYETLDNFVKFLPKDIEKFTENDVKNILLRMFQCTGNNECKAKIDLLNRYVLPLNQRYPEVVTDELIKQLLTCYLSVVLPNKIIVSDGNEDISRFWSLYINYNVNNFIPTLTNHLKELYKTIKTPNFAQYQHMIKYYKAVSPSLNNEMYKFKDYYLSMINDYYLNTLPSLISSDNGSDSTKMMLEIWYSYLCLCGNTNQNQMEFSIFLTKHLKCEQLIDFICLFNKHYIENKTLNMDAFVMLCESLFNSENKSYLLSLDKQKTNTLLEIFKSNAKLNIFLNNFDN